MTKSFTVDHTLSTYSDFESWINESIRLYKSSSKIQAVSSFIKGAITDDGSVFERSCGPISPIVSLYGFVKTSMCISGGSQWEYIIRQVFQVAANKFNLGISFENNHITKGLETDINVVIDGIHITMELKTHDGLDTKKWKATIEDAYEKASITNSYGILGFVTNYCNRNYNNYMSYLSEHSITNFDVCYGADMFRAPIIINSFGKDFSDFCVSLYERAYTIMIKDPKTSDCVYFSSPEDNINYYVNNLFEQFNVLTWSSEEVECLKDKVSGAFKKVNIDDFSDFVKVHLSLICSGNIENLYNLLGICEA